MRSCWALAGNAGWSIVFTGADRIQTFLPDCGFPASLTNDRLEAARDCLKHTREGHDGPIIRPASHVAYIEKTGRPIGAGLVTLVPPVDLEDFWSFQWQTPPPPDGVERRLGHAHLTWIFVGHWFAGYGIGSALLAHASEGLIDLGYSELLSSFIQGNDSSMLWHWRNGFQLLSYPGSNRLVRERARQRQAPSRQT